MFLQSCNTSCCRYRVVGVYTRRHNFAVWSEEPVAKKGKVEWNAAEIIGLLCPVKVATQVTIDPSDEKLHNFAVWSIEQVARIFKVGWNSTDRTLLLCPLMTI